MRPRILRNQRLTTKISTTAKFKTSLYRYFQRRRKRSFASVGSNRKKQTRRYNSNNSCKKREVEAMMQENITKGSRRQNKKLGQINIITHYQLQMTISALRRKSIRLEQTKYSCRQNTMMIHRTDKGSNATIKVSKLMNAISLWANISSKHTKKARRTTLRIVY